MGTYNETVINFQKLPISEMQQLNHKILINERGHGKTLQSAPMKRNLKKRALDSKARRLALAFLFEKLEVVTKAIDVSDS